MPEDEIFCPSCGESTEQAVVKSGREVLLKCSACGMVHPGSQERIRLADVKVIVNRGEVSRPYYINLPASEILRVGGELLVDDGKSDVVMTEIASIETDRRVPKARADEAKTVWARAIDEVEVKFSTFRSGKTRSFKSEFSGDESFAIGDIMKLQGVKFEVNKIKLRNEGFVDKAQAKDILRVWGREI
jgi:uncharacterized Zn finger protein